MSYDHFVTLHASQLQQSQIPTHLWPALFAKLTNELYDANEHFQINPLRIVNEEDPSDVSFDSEICTLQPVQQNNPNSVFIIDHAWTFEMQEARKQLREKAILRVRIAQLMDMQVLEPVVEKEEEADKDKGNEELVDKIMLHLWQYCDFYSIQTAEGALDGIFPKHDQQQQVCMWYVMDEFGARIHHSEEPLCKVVPIYFIPKRMCFSVMWPLRDLEEGDILTCDKLPNVPHDEWRAFYIQPWIYEDMSDTVLPDRVPLNKEHFESHRMAETLPDLTNLDTTATALLSKQHYTVYSDVAFVTNNLTDERFTLTEQPDTADILWLYEHFKDFKSLSQTRPATFINQFPNEAVLTVKDLLAAVCHSRAWYPPTYNLQLELPHFVREFQRREQAMERGELPANQNTWIVKPWNMGRGIGIVVTQQLDQILRLLHTGPMIASEYVTHPVLFRREELAASVKFDIRYMALLKSVQPLQLAVYNVFWLRFANKEYVLDEFEDYERHFTVMNYRHPTHLKQVNCEEFVPLFESQFPQFAWKGVEAKIHNVVRELFIAGCTSPNPFSVRHNPQSRAIYAIDLMLQWNADESDMDPVVCEANYCPDCTRACQYHPSFFNDIFAYLFCDEQHNITLL